MGELHLVFLFNCRLVSLKCFEVPIRELRTKVLSRVFNQRTPPAAGRERTKRMKDVSWRRGRS